MQPSEFLAAVFRGLSEGFVTITRIRTKERGCLTKWLPAGNLNHVDTLAQQWRMEPGSNLFYGVGVRGREQTEHDRGKERDIIALPGLWADLDFTDEKGVKASGKNYPPRSVAEQALDKMPHCPSMIVETGGGWHVYWLFTDLMETPTDARRTTAKQITTGWRNLLTSKIRTFGEYDVDSTHDLARVLRPPGSWNFRHAKDVVLHADYIDPELWKRYDPADFEPYAAAAVLSVEASGPEYTCGNLSLDPSVKLDFERFDSLCTNCPDFKKAWDHTKKMPKDSSLSGYDFSLASYAITAGWTDQEIANLLIAHRRKYAPEDTKGTATNLGYIPGVIAKQRGVDDHEAALRVLNDDPAAESNGEEPSGKETESRAEILSALTKLFKVPVARWLQLGTERPIYSLVLTSGVEIRIGGVREVIEGDSGFRQAIYAATGKHLDKITAARWKGVCEKLAQICDVIEAPDATDAASVRAALASYLAKKGVFGPGQRDQACAIGAPFVEGGSLFLAVEPARKWINLHGADRWQKKDLLESMRRLGFVYQVVAYTGATGKRTSRSYWSCSIGLFSEQLAEHMTALEDQ